ncbi:MAG TPA: MmcQ/YjbR family DNA-binding protein [Gaiellaceae bacterium]|nr:MmcQ/YjbR family DNA-binding protein [Gaiellaceae bacterium]
MRAVCLGLPAVEERPSHGAPTFFVEGKKSFVMFMDNHHGDGRVALWCAAAPGVQEALVDGNPDGYFRPPYVGHRGWVGVRLDRGLAWDEVEGTIEDAWAHVAPRRLLDQLA